jgi:hypothetical protein
MKNGRKGRKQEVPPPFVLKFVIEKLINSRL